MVTDNERREVARRLREQAEKHPEMSLLMNVAFADDSLRSPKDAMEWRVTTHDAAMRLADLIDPPGGFDLDTVQRVCFECMEGCDEPEWTLYTTLYDAIARYKRGESGPTYDCEALVSMANEYERLGLTSVSRRIRKALGASDDVIDFEEEVLRKSQQKHGHIFFCGEYQPDYMVDREALLALADEMRHKAQEYVERFDENSGTATMLTAYASRVYEALGVFDDGQE